MVSSGEVVGKEHNTTTCTGCNKTLHLKVCRSAAGWYIGYFCSTCGPYSRESHYYRTMEGAETALEDRNVKWR